jgi:hypothetical protein
MKLSTSLKIALAMAAFNVAANMIIHIPQEYAWIGLLAGYVIAEARAFIAHYFNTDGSPEKEPNPKPPTPQE